MSPQRVRRLTRFGFILMLMGAFVLGAGVNLSDNRILLVGALALLVLLGFQMFLLLALGDVEERRASARAILDYVCELTDTSAEELGAQADLKRAQAAAEALAEPTPLRQVQE